MVGFDMAIRYRRASRMDLPGALRVYREAFKTLRGIYAPNSESLARQEEQFDLHLRIVATDGGVVVGTVQLCPMGNHLMLVGLAVAPSHWRKGIGLGMVRACERRAWRMGCHQLSLNTIAETGNVPVFEAMGFVSVREEVPAWCESPEDKRLTEVHMRREINPLGLVARRRQG